MNHHSEHKLTDMVEDIEEVSQQNDTVSVDDILSVVGRRSFGPLLVIIGLFLTIPGASDIPGVPTIFGLLILLTVGQQLLGREYIWLPDWLLKRSVKQKYAIKTTKYAKKPARTVDNITTERLSLLVNNRLSHYASALACISIALLTPAMEVVFFSANVAGVSLFLFGLAYLTHDGLVMLLSFLAYSGLLAILLYGLVW